MQITRFDIIDELKKQWKTSTIRIADMIYWSPKMSEVEDLVYGTYFQRYKYLREIMDCDDFSFIFKAFVIQERYKQIVEKRLTKEERFSWSLGIADGYLKRYKRNVGHSFCICLTRDKGWVVIDVIPNIIRRVEDEDKVHFALF